MNNHGMPRRPERNRALGDIGPSRYTPRPDMQVTALATLQRPRGELRLEISERPGCPPQFRITYWAERQARSTSVFAGPDIDVLADAVAKARCVIAAYESDHTTEGNR